MHRFIAYAHDGRTATGETPEAAMVGLLAIMGLARDLFAIEQWTTPDHYDIVRALDRRTFGAVAPNPATFGDLTPTVPVVYDPGLSTCLIADARRMGFQAAVALASRGGALALARMLADQLEAAGRLLVQGEVGTVLLEADRLVKASKAQRRAKPRRRRR